MKWEDERRWLLTPFAVLGALVFSGAAALTLASQFGVWDLPIAGAACAATLVVTTFLMAPTRKPLFGFISFALGAWVAWAMLKDANWPDSYLEVAYRPTLTPLWVTWISGLLTLITCIALQGLAAADRQALAGT